jgi:hypothetical protein
VFGGVTGLEVQVSARVQGRFRVQGSEKLFKRGFRKGFD